MIRFGPAGNSLSFYEKGYTSSVQAPAYLTAMGLTCYEYSCGRGVNIGEGTARKLAESAAAHGIAVSVHAPYFTNLANPDKREATIGYLMAAAQAVSFMGGQRVVFHPGALMKRSREEAMAIARETMAMAVSAVEQRFPQVVLCPETLGKRNQLGTLDEVLELCLPHKKTLPVLDFAHLHAAGGGCIKGVEAYRQILKRAVEVLGMERMRHFHIHFSHVEYTAAGEKRHRRFDEEGYGPDFTPLAEALLEFGLEPTIICESNGTMAEDAAVMRDIYLHVKNKAGIG